MKQEPAEYVKKNEETLLDLIKHSQNDFVRSLALAAILEFGEDPTVDAIVDDLRKIEEERGYTSNE